MRWSQRVVPITAIMTKLQSTPGRHSKIWPPMVEMGLGCAKTPALAPHVEISLINCTSESQNILHTRGSMPYWRIVFSTFRECMSFYTARVITEHHAVLRPCLLCPRKQALLGAMWAERKQAGRKEGQVSDCCRRACQVRQGITADERSSAVHAGLKLRNT